MLRLSFRGMVFLLIVCISITALTLIIGQARADSVLAVLEYNPFSVQMHIMDVDRPGFATAGFFNLAICQIDWTPDGFGLTFAQLLPHVSLTNYNLYRTSIFLSGVEQLTNSVGSNRVPAWSPVSQNPSLAYVSTDDKDTNVMLLENRDSRLLARLPAISVNALHWSPDGRYLVLAFFQGGGSLLEVATGEMRALRAFAADFAWSPDSRYLIYAARVVNESDIYLLDVTTNEELHLVDDPAIDVSPVFSARGGRIAFVRYGQMDRVMVIKSIGSLPQALPLPVFSQIDHLRWSPDGQRLAFSARYADVDGRDLPLAFDLYVADADGDNVQLVRRGVGHGVGIESHFCPAVWRP